MRDAAKQRSTRMLPFEPFDDALIEIVVRLHQRASLVPGRSASLADQDQALRILAAFVRHGREQLGLEGHHRPIVRFVLRRARCLRRWNHWRGRGAARAPRRAAGCDPAARGSRACRSSAASRPRRSRIPPGGRRQHEIGGAPPTTPTHDRLTAANPMHERRRPRGHRVIPSAAVHAREGMLANVVSSSVTNKWPAEAGPIGS